MLSLDNKKRYHTEATLFTTILSKIRKDDNVLMVPGMRKPVIH